MDSIFHSFYINFQRAILLLIALVPLAYISSWIAFFALPSLIPPPGQAAKGGICKRMFAHARAWVSGHAGLLSGYQDHSTHLRPFIIPKPSLEPVVMLPREHQKWLVSQPPTVLSQRHANVESYALDRLFPSVDMHNELMINVVKRHMAGRIGNVQSVMYQEMSGLIDERLGGMSDKSGAWTEVNLATFLRDVILRMGYRVHVGEELCRDKQFAAASWNMTLWAGIGTMIIGQFSPPFLKAPFGWLCSLPISWSLRRYRDIILPVFQDQIVKVGQKLADPGMDYEPPQDAMTWTAQILLEKNPDGERLEDIIDNFMTLFTAAFATIPVTLHAVLNLMGLAEAREYLPYLRAEIDAVFADPEAWDDPHTTAPGRTPLLEAFLRESMRHTPFFTRGQEHKVLARDGVALPDGARVPAGTFLACPVAGIARDERFYAAPDAFDPWRFLDRVDRECVPAGSPGDCQSRYALRPNCQLTSPSDVFLGFGFGRHACPGRFFAARIMKLIVSYLVLHYDFEAATGGRPGNVVVGSFTIPPVLARARFRRRAGQGAGASAASRGATAD